ncbi:MAG: DNA polymerase III subunit gamma/tau [Desulfobacterium sp.]
MSYRVLALKYRPQTFQDVIGQTHVTQTLSNAILSSRVAHAILFSGPRGTGKTSIARILAKAMNCEAGPTPSPCNKCKSCIEITAGNATDVFEVDGASNNSVDQIRELRENVTYLPISSPRKIYIIDEVHMLSTAAFNALLKTLEEPPEHVLFIFATTEPHKIPITILSRCQRHNLGRIGLTEIANHLEWLASQEGFKISRESASLIASEGDGSMRDSLSLLDRVISSSSDVDISHDHILNNLGIIDKKILLDMASAIFRADGAEILQTISRVRDLGFDLKKIYADLVELFRNILVVKLCPDSHSFSDISAHDREQLSAMTVPGTHAYLSQILTLLLKEEQLIRFSTHTRTALETILLQLTQIRPGTDMDAIITRLDALARNVAPPEPLSRHLETGVASARTNPTQVPPPRESQCNEGPATYTPPEQTAPPTPHWDGPPDLPRQRDNTPRRTTPGSATPALNRKIPANEPPPPTGMAAPDTEKKTWEGFINAIIPKLPFIGAILSKSTFKGIHNKQICVALSGNSSFDLKRIQSKQKALEGLCENYFGEKLSLSLENPQENNMPPRQESSPGGVSPAKLKQEAMNHPLVADAVTLFSGQIVDIKLS